MRSVGKGTPRLWMWLVSLVTQAGPLGYCEPPRNPPMSTRLGPQDQLTWRVPPGGTSMNPLATTSKIGLSGRFTSFALRVTKVIFARPLCDTLSALIQCELSTRPMTILPERSEERRVGEGSG